MENAAPTTPIDDRDNFENSFRKKYPLLWFSTLIGPFLLTAAILVVLYFVRGAKWMWGLVGTAVFTFFVLGKFAIIFGADVPAESVQVYEIPTVWEIFVMLVYMDLITAMLLAFHTGYLFQLPWVGPKMSALATDGRFILKSNPWMERATFVGLVAFVVFPLAATGSIGGSIFGRLLGMSRGRVLLGVCLGSIIGCGLMYLCSGLVRQVGVDPKDPVFLWGGIAVIAALLLLLNHRYQRAKARFLKLQAAEDREDVPATP